MLTAGPQSPASWRVCCSVKEVWLDVANHALLNVGNETVASSLLFTHPQEYLKDEPNVDQGNVFGPWPLNVSVVAAA